MEKEELIEKYNIDLKKLENEQLKLAKNLEIKDNIDFSVIFDRIGAIENLIIKNKIISAMVVVDKDFEIIEQEYVLDKLRFPYIHGFKAYRELPSMTTVFKKIREKPDIVFVKGEGITHSRLGMASHFALSIGLPVIAVNDKLFEGNKIEGENILKKDEITGRVLVSKKGSKPLFISPGNQISINSAYEVTRKMIIPPHKMPEPLHIAHKYSKDIQKEMRIN